MSNNSQEDQERYNEVKDEITDFVENFKDDLKAKYNQKYKGYVDKLDGLRMPVNKYTSLMYVAQFLNFFFRFSGLICSLIMWKTKKNKDFFIHSHGRNIFNWLFSAILYVVVSLLILLVLNLTFNLSDFQRFIIFGFGIFVALVIFLCSFIFTVIGALRAYQKKLFKYPLTISFIK
jgi:uncharacterized Tic20 family protein